VLELPHEIPNANRPAPGFSRPMKANDKSTKAFPLVDGKFCLSKWWTAELGFWLIMALAAAPGPWLARL
jgi:hypothetical protein